MRKKRNQKIIYLTVQEAAKQIRYSPRQVYRFIRDEQLTVSKPKGGRKYLIAQDAVDEFIQRSQLKRKRKVTTEEVEVSINLDNVLQRKEHFKQLARVATEILGGLSNVQVLGKNSFRCYGLEEQPGFNSKVLNREKLVNWVHINMIATYNQNSALFNSFRIHLTAEEAKREDLYKYLESSPVEFFKLLQKVALRKTFQGRCEICKDWY